MVFKKTRNDALERVSAAQFRQQGKLPVTLVLDNIRSMHNVGSAFRTSDAFLVERIVLTGITGRPPHREIQKTALGATESVEWSYQNDVVEAIAQLKRQGYIAVMIEQAQPHISLAHFVPHPGQHYALIFGNEVAGVSPEALELVASEML